MKPRVVVAEEIAAAGLAHLREACEVDVAVDASRPDLLRRVRDAAALVVRSATRVDAELIAAAPVLRVIGRAGIGVDNIDLEAATRAGVLVVNAPTSNAVSAAEHTLALLLAQARRIPEADRAVRSGRWERRGLEGIELHGKTLGIVGLGRIGGLVAQRAAGFGMSLLGFDPFVSEEGARRLGVETAGTLEELMSRSDFVTIHLPLTRDTENLIDAAALEAARPGIRIVNASRGGVVDEAALAAAVEEGRVAGAALDVVAEEPLTESPLFALPQVVLTPHLGASTVEAQDKAGTDVARAVVDALGGDLVPSAVNVDLGREVPDDWLPFLPVAEQLGGAFVALARGLPAEFVLRVEGRVAGRSCRPLALAALKGALSQVTDRPVTFVNAPLLAESHGVAVTEESTPEVADYQSVIRLSGDVAGERVTVAGTVVERTGPVLVEALDHKIELPFSESMLLLVNDDVPGVIGRVGTYLGERGVNIADMVVGRPSSGGVSAMMGLNLARGLEEPEIEGFRALPGVIRAWFLDLS